MRVIASMAGSSDTVKSQRTATEVSGGDSYNYYWLCQNSYSIENHHF